jgi:integrase
MSFDELLKSRQKQRVFRFSTGYQPHSFIGTFRRLMRDSGLTRAADGQNRTLYSLRHTYATMELLAGVEIHTLAKQLGNSAQMIEQYYSKLTATLAAERLA